MNFHIKPLLGLRFFHPAGAEVSRLGMLLASSSIQIIIEFLKIKTNFISTTVLKENHKKIEQLKKMFSDRMM
jgi:hypothetical protein